MTRATVWLALGLLGVCAACLGPYQIIGQELDPLHSLGDQPTWIQATPQQTTLLVFATPDGGLSAPFTLTTIARDQSTIIYAGTYTATATQVTLNSTLKYVLKNQNNLPVTSRDGAMRFDVDAGATYASTLDGGILTLTGNPPLGSFASFPQALANLKATNQAEADCLLRVYDLTAISSETRILGFNGPAIIQYTTEAGFNGVLSGDVNISVESLFNPNVTLTYQNYSDFSGFVMDGTQYTHTDLSGNGWVSNTIAFSMTRPSSDGGALLPVISGAVGYGNADGSPPTVLISTGTPTAGSYTLSIDGGASFLVAYDVLFTMDVTACVSTPQQ